MACTQCHTNNNYTSTPTACYACHQADFTGTTNPDHVAWFPDRLLDLPYDQWLDPVHVQSSTAFPLTGAHATVPCTQCHTNNNYITLPTNCYACHQADFTGSTNPNHVAAGSRPLALPATQPVNWTSVTFDHAIYAHYPLTGAHATFPARSATRTTITPTPTDCYSCHQADFTERRVLLTPLWLPDHLHTCATPPPAGQARPSTTTPRRSR